MNDARRGYTAAAKLAKAKAIQHMKFAASFWLEQIQAGRYFLHDHGPLKGCPIKKPTGFSKSESLVGALSRM